MLVAQALDEGDRGVDVMCRVFLGRALIGVCPTRLSANGKSYDKKILMPLYSGVEAQRETLFV